MAVMLRLPDTATIMACRQKVDFYLWKGTPVARKWPRKPQHYTRSAAEVNTQQRMGAVASMTGAIDESVRSRFIGVMGEAQGVTWVDFFRSVAMGTSDWIR